MIANELSVSTGQHGQGGATSGFASPHVPIPILRASFCRIFHHIGTPTFGRHTADRSN